MKMGYYWSKDDIEFLENNYKTMSVKEIASKLCKSRNSVYYKMQQINAAGKIEDDGGEKSWDSGEIDFVCENYGRMKAKDIAEALGRSVNAVRRIASIYGVTRYREPEEGQRYEEYIECLELLNKIKAAFGRPPLERKKNPY